MDTGRRKWVVLGAAVLAYAVAMMHRASLGVAGLEAADHFNTTPSIVSTFVVLQLATYAFGQLGSGTLLDRFGARVMLTFGSSLMVVGQLMLGAVDVLALAYVARFLVGLGDACIYISILSIIPRWFAPRLVPLLTQLVGMLAVVGQLLAIYALFPAIQRFGWQAGITAAAMLGAVMTVAVYTIVRDAPSGATVERPRDPLSQLHKGFLEVLKHPGTQLGFAIHFTSGFSMNAFVFMWGLPYLKSAQGLSQAAASGLFTLISVSGMFIGPVVGMLTARHPLRRSNLALAVIWAGLLAWVVVLLLPVPAPMWLLVALGLALAAGGPGTAIGFDFPRTMLPPTRMGVANGIVISGAFLGATLTIFLIGTVLEFLSGGATRYTFDQYRVAMTVQIPLYIGGLVAIYVTRTRLRRRMASKGVIVPPWREAITRRWANRHRR
jgi:MFS family permease